MTRIERINADQDCIALISFLDQIQKFVINRNAATTQRRCGCKDRDLVLELELEFQTVRRSLRIIKQLAKRGRKGILKRTKAP